MRRGLLRRGYFVLALGFLFLAPTLVFGLGAWLALHVDNGTWFLLGMGLAGGLCVLQGFVRHEGRRAAVISAFVCAVVTLVAGFLLYLAAAAVECQQFDNCLLS